MRHFLPRIEASDVLERMGLAPKDYIPVTAHRSENVDNAVYLARLFEALGEMASHYGRKIIFPMHPRTRSKYDEFRGPQERKYYVTAGVLRLQQTAQGSSLSALSLQAHRGGNANDARDWQNTSPPKWLRSSALV